MDSDYREKAKQFSLDISRQIEFIIRQKIPNLSTIDKEDIAQEVHLKIWNILKKERKINNFRSYLWRVVYTTALDYLDKKMDTLSFDADLVLDYSNPVLEMGVMTEEKLLEKKELRIKIEEAVESLKSKMRTVMKAHLAGMNIRETAEFLGWKESQVNTLYHRAKKQLKIKLASTLDRSI